MISGIISDVATGSADLAPTITTGFGSLDGAISAASAFPASVLQFFASTLASFGS